MAKKEMKDSPAFEASGNELRRLRLKHGLTQAELAKKLGDVHTQFVSNWERGLCAPPTHVMGKLSKILTPSTWDRNQLREAVLDDSGRAALKRWGLII